MTSYIQDSAINARPPLAVAHAAAPDDYYSTTRKIRLFHPQKFYTSPMQLYQESQGIF